MNERFVAWLQSELAERGVEGVAAAARAIGVSQSMVSNWLNGRTAPNRKSLRRVATWSGRSDADVLALLDQDATSKQAAGYVVSTPAATVTLTDPRAVGYFFGFLSRFERMTEEEKNSLLPDEVDIPAPPTRSGENGDARGGAHGATGPGGAGR